MRLALKHRQMFDVVHTGIHDLHSGAARTDHGHLLAHKVQGRIPPGGVNRRAGERVRALQIREPRPIQVTRGGDDHPGMVDALRSVGGA